MEFFAQAGLFVVAIVGVLCVSEVLSYGCEQLFQGKPIDGLKR